MSSSQSQAEAFERFCSFSALYDASYKICRNVRWKDSTINFEEQRLENIFATQDALKYDEWIQLLFSCFSIVERGKPRDIRACHIDDRLVHNAFCDEVLTPEISPIFIYDNSASQVNKGIDFALSRVKRHLQKAQMDYGMGKTFYGLRIDISKYFDSIDHQELKNLLRSIIKYDRAYELISYIIDTFAYRPTKDKTPSPNKQYYITYNEQYVPWKGELFSERRQYFEYHEKSLGLGSQTSQFLALFTLNGIDHYVKEQLHCKYYGRYMDDSYILHNDKKYLQYCKDEIEKQLQKIGLSLNKKKTCVSSIVPVHSFKQRKQPFKFLKWNFYITDTNHIIQLPFKEKIHKQRRKLRKMHRMWLDGEIDNESLLQSYHGWRTNMMKGNSFYIVQDMDNYFKSLFKGVDII